MGKITGFLEYERKDKKEIDPKERIKNFSSFHIPFTEEEQKEFDIQVKELQEEIDKL